MKLIEQPLYIRILFAIGVTLAIAVVGSCLLILCTIFFPFYCLGWPENIEL